MCTFPIFIHCFCANICSTRSIWTSTFVVLVQVKVQILIKTTLQIVCLGAEQLQEYSHFTSNWDIPKNKKTYTSSGRTIIDVGREAVCFGSVLAKTPIPPKGMNALFPHSAISCTVFWLLYVAYLTITLLHTLENARKWQAEA